MKRPKHAVRKKFEIDQENLVSIYRWIEQNKPNLPNGVYSSTLFSHVVKKCDGSGEYYPQHIKVGSPDYNTYVQYIYRLRNRGWLKNEALTPRSRGEWSVNESTLPAGVVTYTGVHQYIPLEAPKPVSEPEPKTPLILPAVENKSEAVQEFLEAELKSIKVRECRLGNGNFMTPHAYIELHNTTLWNIYKLGLALQNTLGTQYDEEKEDEQRTTEQQAQPTDSVDSTEEAEECEPTSYSTESPF